MRTWAVSVLVLFLAGCASQSPVLYPNPYLTRVGHEQAEQDIAECRELADQYVKSGGAGTVAGSPGTGAAVGAATGATAGFLRGLFTSAEPSPTYKNFVNQCLRERGYEPVGWE